MSSIPTAAFSGLRAGAARTDITPREPVFLFGYPHVPRTSTGVHDALECAALYVADAGGAALFLAHDLIFFPLELVTPLRRRIADATGVPAEAIMFTATHTHSGPLTADMISNEADPVVPRATTAYRDWLAERVFETAVQAVRRQVSCEIGYAVARANGVGSNRHDPAGPSDPSVPVLVVRDAADHRTLAAMLVYAMHPTVLHEDSTLISGDFPHFTREYLRRVVLGPECVILYHQGAAGDQSPRHVTRANTFPEARRIGELLGAAVAPVIATMSFQPAGPITARLTHVALTPRSFPTARDAEAALAAARARHLKLKDSGAAGPVVRTAECDVFGAEETLELARAAIDGRLTRVVAERTPAEIQAIRVGPVVLAAWPGEFFVEYALAVRARCPHAWVVTLANGELQGYIVTDAAVTRGSYEASNAAFAHTNGARFIAATVDLVAEL